jgi:hypothetical protein
MSQPWREIAVDDDPPTEQDIALAILLEAESLSQLMELHYYTGEPGFLDIARVLAALSDDEREELRAFVAEARERRIRIRRDGARIVIECVPR